MTIEWFQQYWLTSTGLPAQASPQAKASTVSKWMFSPLERNVFVGDLGGAAADGRLAFGFGCVLLET